MPAVIATFIPIVFFLTIGLIWITVIYFRSREKQMLIEKGLSTEEIKLFFEEKKRSNPFLLAQIGTISIFFGFGLGIGLYLEDITTKEYWIPFCLFAFTGLGFIVANIIGRRFGKE
jgi:hypothetical protein